MITNEQQFVLDALRQSLNAEIDNLSSWQTVELNTDDIIHIIKRNGVLNTVYPVLGIFTEIQDVLNASFLAAIKQSVIQNYEGKQILKGLTSAGFDCIALKGWEMQKLYPDPTMRQMADLDILVRPYKFHEIKDQMISLGYVAGKKESAWMHDNFKKNTVTVEIHKRLTDDSDEIQSWEKGLWDRAIAVEGNIYKMSKEDYYIFHFVHLYKDFLNGSLGLRRIVDTWLLHKQIVETSTVQNYFERFGMWHFHEQMIHLSRVVMGEEELDTEVECLLSHAFKYGIYGSSKSYKTGRIVTMGGNVRTGKIGSAFSAVFLPYKRMKAQFPLLEKWPILLPYCWIKRITRFLRGDIKKYLRMLDYSDVCDADYNEMKRFFEAGGIIDRQ